MAKTPLNLALTILFLSFLVIPNVKSQEFARKLSKREMGLKREKITHFKFYFHDTLSGKNPTAVVVAQAAMTKTSTTYFGLVVVIDNPLTVGPNITSKLVGRAQGIYVPAAQNETAVLMAFNYVFLEGKYNGSTLSILGRNSVYTKVREMPIVGGSGVFRYARGYAQAKTYSSNPKTFDSVLEQNVYVLHY